MSRSKITKKGNTNTASIFMQLTAREKKTKKTFSNRKDKNKQNTRTLQMGNKSELYKNHPKPKKKNYTFINKIITIKSRIRIEIMNHKTFFVACWYFLFFLFHCLCFFFFALIQFNSILFLSPF